MYFYEVWVRSHRYQNDAPLTYRSDTKLQIGTIVLVPLKTEQVPAFIVASVAQPNFACKAVAKVFDLSPLPKATLELLSWLKGYYPAPIGPLAQLAIPAGLGPKTKPLVYSEEKLKIDDSLSFELNEEQRQAVTTMEAPGSYLLHGRTGGGKTRVYAALARKALQTGKSVAVLTPEIGLTPQLASTLAALIGSDIILLHSNMTPKERRERWLHILGANTPLVVVGPRSALFCPLNDIGLIVIDEAHEPAYKQEQQPYYYAPRVAAKLAQLHGASLVLGSATPPISEYYLATQKRRPVIRLKQLAAGQTSEVAQQLVDIKDRSLFTASPHLSDPLIAAVRTALNNGEQTLLYLNRRGTARLSLCLVCGWQATCPRCDLPLTYHGDAHQLLCHTCGYHSSPFLSCPTCGNTELVFRSAGTKAIAEEAQRLFGEARVQRFDTDNIKAERLERHYDAVRAGNVDILVGTQLLAKGLDLPRLSTVGIILADTSLAIPDFSAQERTYQLIHQVIGRIGRGHVTNSAAVIQTAHADSAAIAAALSGDWDRFYNTELAERRQFGFPPFRHLLKLTCRRASAGSAERACRQLKTKLENLRLPIEIDGPAPAFHEHAAKAYEWQLVIKSRQRSALLTVIKSLPSSGWSYDIDPLNLL